MKALKNWHLPMIILSFALVLGLGLAAQHLFHDYSVVKPLEDGFTTIEGVEHYSLKQTDADLVVTLGNIPNLETTFQEIVSVGSRTLNNGFSTLVMHDKRTDDLEKIYHNLHFILYEGIATGRFTEMQTRIDEALAQSGLTFHNVTVTGDFVLVQLHQGDNYLYEVVPRKDGLQVIARVEGRGPG